MASTTRAERPALEAVGIRKRYGRKPALDDVLLRVAAGETVAVVGENGSGKTTLLRVCAGVLRLDAGSVAAAGRVGYCPQQPALLDLLNADEHLALFGAALGLPTREALEQGREALAELRFPIDDPTRAGELSGGSRQKLNLALALVGDPPPAPGRALPGLRSGKLRELLGARPWLARPGQGDRDRHARPA